MANGEHWFEDMAKALKRQDHAARMVAKWQQVLADARAEVVALSAQVQTDNGTQVSEQVQEQEQEPVNAV